MTDTLSFNKDASLRVKGVAVLLMIAHHFFTQGVFSNITSVPLSQIFIQIGVAGKICVSIFMFIGGYAYLLSKEKSMLRRVWHIYKKFLVTFLIVTIILSLFKKLYVTPQEYIQNALCISWEINGSWWFISTYILNVIAFSILRPYRIKNIYVHLFILIICIVVIQPFSDYLQTIQSMNSILKSQLHYFLYYVGFFYLGMMFFQFKLFNRIKKTKVTTLALLLFGLLLLLVIRIVFKYNGVNFLVVPIFISLLCYLPQKEIVLKFLGKYSMGMWLVHMFFVYDKYFLHQIAITTSPLLLYLLVTTLSLLYAVSESYFVNLCKETYKYIKTKCLRE